MKQAKPTADESLAFLRFMQGLESILERGEILIDEGDTLRITDALMIGWLAREWERIGPIWKRVFFAGQVAIDNACDPNADTLEWREELKEAAEKIQ